MSKALWVLFIALCLGFICFIALTPVALSTTTGTSLLLKAVNRNIPGTIDIGSLSLSWLGTQKIENLSLKSPENQTILSLKSLTLKTPLLQLWRGKNVHEISITGLEGKIEQDGAGATNLEEALGLKKVEKPLKTAVFIENVNLSLNQGDGLLSAKATGSTRQNTLNGQFAIDISLPKEGDQKLSLSADHFPTLVLDQSLALSNPRLSGVLLALLGESIDISADQSAGSVQLKLTSPHVKGNIRGELSSGNLQIAQGSAVSFSVPPENLEKLKLPIQFLEQLQGELTIEEASVPLELNLLKQIAGQMAFTIKPNRVKYEGKVYALSNFTSQLLSEKDSPSLHLKVQLEAKENERPISLNLKAEVPKAIDNFRVEGVRFSSELNSPQVKSTWKGRLRESDTKIKGELNSDLLSFKELTIDIPYLPLKKILQGKQDSPLEGSVTLLEPKWNASCLPVDEIAVPWTLDLNANTLKLNLIGKEGKKEVIKGSVWADQIRTIDKAPLQFNVMLEDFNIEGICALFPNHPLKRILGSRLDAGFTATRDSKGFIEGSLEITASKNSDVFLKKIISRFSMQNNNQDMTFHTETQQAIGTTRFLGTLHNVWNDKGRFTRTVPSISFQGNLKHFPVAVMTKIITGDDKIADAMEAAVGCQVDAELFAEIKNQQGPVRASLKGLNGQCSLDGRIEDHALLLNEPLLASLKVTPQLEHTVLRKYLPLLGSVLSAEKPIELTVPVTGFRLPLAPLTLENLQFREAELKLNKMQFLKDSPLGKIVSLIGVQTPQFEVWFTPIYFSLEKQRLRMERTDMLVANAYPFAAWGLVDLKEQEIDLRVALSPPTLKKVFSLDAKADTWFQVPIKGPISQPKIDTVSALTNLSTLTALSEAGPPGKLIGTAFETARDLMGDRVPPPTTTPLPWADQVIDPPATPSPLEKPIQEIKKGAKKILKEIFQ